MTPMLEGQLENPKERAQIEAFPVPIGHFGDASHIGDWVAFMLSRPPTFWSVAWCSSTAAPTPTSAPTTGLAAYR